MVIKVIAVAMWIAMFTIFFIGVRARLRPSEPRWTPAVVTAFAVTLFVGGAISYSWLDDRVNYGVEE